MTFTEANTVEAHLRDLLAGAASARQVPLATGLASMCGKIAGLGWHYVAPADFPLFGVRASSVTGFGKQM